MNLGRFFQDDPITATRQDGPASGRSGRSLTAEEKEAEKAWTGDFWNKKTAEDV